jgi:hypothetical protein
VRHDRIHRMSASAVQHQHGASIGDKAAACRRAALFSAL